MPTVSEFRSEIEAQIDRAQRQDRPHIEINAGELHRVVGGYPPKAGEHHTMPVCRSVMRDEMKDHDFKIIYEPDSGDGASLTIRYYLAGRGNNDA